jgi:predicted Zn-dependent protease
VEARVKRTLALLAAFLASSAAPAQDLYRNADAQRVSAYKGASVAYEKALGKMKDKDLDGALDALVVCFEQMPDYPDGHLLKARILYTEKEYTRALGEIEAARAGWEKVADLRQQMELGKRKPIEERIQSKDQAIYDMRTLLASTPPERRRPIEEKIQQLQHERDVLVRELQQWSTASEKVPATYSALHGTILLRLDRPAEAVPRYEEALATDPGSSEAANNLASIYHLAGKNERAMEIVQAAKKRGAKLHPDLERSIEAALAAKK